MRVADETRLLEDRQPCLSSCTGVFLGLALTGWDSEAVVSVFGGCSRERPAIT